jgi:soluble epoxide hydrolase/lipid-phosphate phosphatase
MSLGWRYQIPYLVDLGYRTIALDCMGYGKTVCWFAFISQYVTPTDSLTRRHKGFSTKLQDYGFRAHANAIAAIARQINTTQLILGGHDWGGATVYRVAQWYPDLIAAVFSVATPYSATSRTYTSTRTLAEGKLPNFGYQLQFGSDDGVMERLIGNDEKLVEKFLNGMYGGRTSSRRKFMTPERGVDLGIMRDDEIARNPFFEDEVSWSFTYVFAFPEQLTDNTQGTRFLHKIFPQQQPRRANELVPHTPCQLRRRARASWSS